MAKLKLSSVDHTELKCGARVYSGMNGAIEFEIWQHGDCIMSSAHSSSTFVDEFARMIYEMEIDLETELAYPNDLTVKVINNEAVAEAIVKDLVG